MTGSNRSLKKTAQYGATSFVVSFMKYYGTQMKVQYLVDTLTRYEKLRSVNILTFGGPCIVIYSYNKTNEMLISQIYFWNRVLSVSDRFSIHHHESSTVYTSIGICHTGYADCLPAGSRWNILIPPASSQQNLYDIYLLLCIQY